MTKESSRGVNRSGIWGQDQTVNLGQWETNLCDWERVARLGKNPAKGSVRSQAREEERAGKKNSVIERRPGVLRLGGMIFSELGGGVTKKGGLQSGRGGSILSRGE